MKTRNLVLSSAVCLLFFSSCFTSQKASKFNSSDINLGMDKTEFIKGYGDPRQMNRMFVQAHIYQSFISIYFNFLPMVPTPQ